ncbi:NAD(P)/FAD-dependent oxidoreductase [Streptomyces sp. NPDC006333]|uniref:FAD-dependent oxidoreductase n=1 Tax=Streptomyces sp. NPDC006333 TaxID=3156753 RepID=UPI0033A0CFD3
MPVHELAVLGAGVSGLALAVQHTQLGGSVDVYERRRAVRPDGLAFILQENGLAALERLGLRDEAVRGGRELTEYQLFDHRGNELAQEKLDNCVGVRRGDLIDALLSRLPAQALHVGKSFVRFGWSAADRAATAHFTDGTTAEADWFAGSDGIRSAVRSQLFPGHSLSPVRVNDLVSFAPTAALGLEATTRFSKIVHSDGGLAVGYLPCGDEVVWFLQFDTFQYPCENAAAIGLADFCRQTLAGWPPMVQRLIEATDFTRSHLWASTRLTDPLRDYVQGNVILLGDAAHPLPSVTSQGVNSALEDAVALADALADVAPLADYSTSRAEHIARYIAQGMSLQADFLAPVNGDPVIPLARSASKGRL